MYYIPKKIYFEKIITFYCLIIYVQFYINTSSLLLTLIFGIDVLHFNAI